MVVRIWHGRTSGSQSPLIDGENDAWMRPPRSPTVPCHARERSREAHQSSVRSASAMPDSCGRNHCEIGRAQISKFATHEQLIGAQLAGRSTDLLAFQRPVQIFDESMEGCGCDGRPAIARHRLRADAREWQLTGRDTIPRCNHAGRMSDRRKLDLLLTAGEFFYAPVFEGGKR